jgi:hypothetical protein
LGEGGGIEVFALFLLENTLWIPAAIPPIMAATTAPYKPNTITPCATKPLENPWDISSAIPAMKIRMKIGRNTIRKTCLDFIKSAHPRPVDKSYFPTFDLLECGERDAQYFSILVS